MKKKGNKLYYLLMNYEGGNSELQQIDKFFEKEIQNIHK